MAQGDFEFDLDSDICDFISTFSDDDNFLCNVLSEEGFKAEEDISDISCDGVTTSDANTAVLEDEISHSCGSVPLFNESLNHQQNNMANQAQSINFQRVIPQLNTQITTQNQEIEFVDSVGPYLLQSNRILSSSTRDEEIETGFYGNKRVKREERLIKNREAANKSRMKRKNQLSDMEEAVNSLTQKNTELEKEIAGLRAENAVLIEQNNFLKTIFSDRAGSAIASLKPAMSGVACLGIVCMTSFVGNQVWSSLLPTFLSHSSVSQTSNHVQSGRVLLSINDPIETLYEDVSDVGPKTMLSCFLSVFDINHFLTCLLSTNRNETYFSYCVQCMCYFLFYILILWGLLIVKNRITKIDLLQHLPI